MVSIALASPTPGALAAEGLSGKKTGSASDRPWAEGVSKADRDKAIKLFQEGTGLLKDAFFTKAVARYREALGHWDHPAIHFNLSKALMNLDDPAAAYTHLKAAMRFGGPPLDEEQIKQVKHYTDLLYKEELAEVMIETKEPGAVVTMDGVELFVGPGHWSGVVRPDKTKTIIATKKGFQTAQLAPLLLKGQVNPVEITMTPLDMATRYEREFSNAIPWTVIGGGILLLGGGALMTWQSNESFKTYDEAVATCNGEFPHEVTDDNVLVTQTGVAGTCIAEPSVTSMKDDGELFQTLSVVGYAAGGAVLTTGLILLYINREKPVEYEDSSVTVLPVAGPGRLGVSASLRF